jgi:hypothetical protein
MMAVVEITAKAVERHAKAIGVFDNFLSLLTCSSVTISLTPRERDSRWSH